jgi:hypothetical protein
MSIDQLLAQKLRASSERLLLSALLGDYAGYTEHGPRLPDRNATLAFTAQAHTDRTTWTHEVHVWLDGREVEFTETDPNTIEGTCRHIEMSVAHVEDTTPRTVTYQNVWAELDPNTIKGTCRHLDN